MALPTPLSHRWSPSGFPAWLIACSLLAAFVFLGTAPVYAVDSAMCGGCHPAIYRSYRQTPMARSSGLVGQQTPAESLVDNAFTNLSGSARFRIGRSQGVLAFDMQQGEIAVHRRLDYFLGSGLIGRSYLTSLNGFLFQAPVSYYSAPARWGLSPGFESAEEVNLIREVEPSCLQCHASGVQAVDGSNNRYAEPPFREGGVSCERCHGSGEEHSRRIQVSTRPRASGIINPAKLEPSRRDAICARCHLTGAITIPRAGNRDVYQPGDRLFDSVSVFVWEGVDREATVNGHVEQLARSACSRASAGKLWCGTCHSPHATINEAEKPAHYRARCLTCHAIESCRETSTARARVQDRCTDCHMPRRTALTVQHAATTDHVIPRRPRPDAPLRIAADAVLASFDQNATGRELGLAYATLGLRDNNRAWAMRALPLLMQANAAAPDDAKVASKLAELYDRMGREEQACALYASLVQREPPPAVAVNHGACLARQGRVEEAVRWWKAATARAPALEAARFNLAVAQFRLGDAAAARATLQEALQVNPASRRARDLLREMTLP